MGRNHSRFGVYALALIACLVAGSAYADSFPRVHAGGQFFHNDPANTVGNFSDRVSFGLEGKCERTPSQVCAPNGIRPPFPCDPTSTDPTTACPFNVPASGPAPKGDFEYENHFNGIHVHGKITDLSFGQASPGCVAFASSFDVNLSGRPSAIVQGTCKDGKCTQFQIEVVDGDDWAPDQGDWVCNVNVQGQNKMHAPATDSDSAEQVNRGDVEVRTTKEH